MKNLNDDACSHYQSELTMIALLSSVRTVELRRQTAINLNHYCWPFQWIQWRGRSAFSTVVTLTTTTSPLCQMHLKQLKGWLHHCQLRQFQFFAIFFASNPNRTKNLKFLKTSFNYSIIFEERPKNFSLTILLNS